MHDALDLISFTVAEIVDIIYSMQNSGKNYGN